MCSCEHVRVTQSATRSDGRRNGDARDARKSLSTLAADRLRSRLSLPRHVDGAASRKGNRRPTTGPCFAAIPNRPEWHRDASGVPRAALEIHGAEGGFRGHAGDCRGRGLRRATWTAPSTRSIWPPVSCAGSRRSKAASWPRRRFAMDGFISGISTGMFHCFDAATGKELWKFETQAEIDPSPTSTRRTCWSDRRTRRLYCLQARTGELVWKHSIADQMRCTPTIVADRVFLAGCDSRLHILDLTNGELVAQVEIKCAHGRDARRPGRQSVLRHRRRGVFLHRLEAGEGGLDLSAPRGQQPYRSSPAVIDSTCRGGWT